MSKKVRIPSHMMPCFVCNVNGRKYIYPAGTIQEVPDDVASVIENFWEMKPAPEEVMEKTDAPAVEPQEEDIPKVFFGAALPQTKDDLVMSFRYISKTQDISGYCKTKAQGNSSMNYPKKNQTVKLYKDAECAEKLEVDFKGWGKQNKFCFKANWIDLTHARNIVSARLWGDVVKSRADYDTLPEDLRNSPNQGAVDGFPVKVYADGIYQGRYTLNIPKDAWMANMEEEQEANCILCGENYVSGCFRAEANIDESDWTDEVHKTVPASIKNRWNDAIRFVMNSTDEEFVAGIGHYFDVPSLIDYYIFGVLSCGLDAYGKNQLYMTWDGMKWYATMYDMDSTWGLYWNGSKIVPTDYARTQYEDMVGDRNGNLLYIRIEKVFTEELKSRWEELKSGALSIENMINRFERFSDISPADLVVEDYASTTGNGSFTDIPSKTVNTIQQLRNFVVARYNYTDTYISRMGSTLLYSLPRETVFAGTEGPDGQKIDTGVKLFDEPKSFTIVLDVTDGAERVRDKAILDCRYGSDGAYVGGVGIKTSYSYDAIGFNILGTSAASGNNTTMPIFWCLETEVRTKMAVVYENGTATHCYYKKAGDSQIYHKEANMYANQSTHDGTVVIGTNNNGWEAFVGTVHSLEIYNYAMTADEIAAEIME